MLSFDRCCVVGRALVVLLPIALCVPVGGAQVEEKMTPALLAVQDAPVPFMGSDGRVHLVYELWVTNFSSADVTVEKVDVLGDGSVLQSLDAAEISSRLQAAGKRESSEKLAGSVQALLFLHVTLAPGARVPARVSHPVTIHANGLPG